MAYQVKEIVTRSRGRAQTDGRRLLPFAACNLWSGHEVDRASAVCRFCDTDFVGLDGPHGGESPAPLTWRCRAPQWPPPTRARSKRNHCRVHRRRTAIAIGCSADRQAPRARLEIAVETNGTLPAPTGLDWICVSPKADRLAACRSDELKHLPQPGRSQASSRPRLPPLFLQRWMPEVKENTRLTVAYCCPSPLAHQPADA